MNSDNGLLAYRSGAESQLLSCGIAIYKKSMNGIEQVPSHESGRIRPPFKRISSHARYLSPLPQWILHFVHISICPPDRPTMVELHRRSGQNGTKVPSSPLALWSAGPLK